METATLGGGCFWCLEAVYDEMEGVSSVESGYMGGRVDNPDYHAVCTGKTGHVEVVQVTFDPARVREDLLATRRVCEKFGCPLEYILKDISTVGYQPSRLWEWADIAMRVVRS